MQKFRIMAAIAGLLLFSGTASAAGQSNHDGHSGGGHGTTHMQPPPAKQQEMKAPDMKMDDAQSHNMTPQEHMNMDNSKTTHGESHESSGGGHGSHGGNAEVVETPPNIPVLSTFGGIMLAFILYGAWNKWLRKKDGAHA